MLGAHPDKDTISSREGFSLSCEQDPVQQPPQAPKQRQKVKVPWSVSTFANSPAGRAKLITSFTSLKRKESDSFVGLGYEVPQSYILVMSLGIEKV